MIVICLGSLRGTFVKLLTGVVRGYSGITSMSPLAHRIDCLRSEPSFCKMSRSLDVEVRTLRGVSDIGRNIVRLHTCTFLDSTHRGPQRTYVRVERL